MLHFCTDDSIEAIEYEMPEDPETSAIMPQVRCLFVFVDGIIGFGYYELQGSRSSLMDDNG